MTIVCIDLEGVLIPEIWHQVAEQTQVPELRLTTRDVADYDELMRMRLRVLKRISFTMADITAIIEQMECLEGAQGFLATLRRTCEVIVVSDTFYQFSTHFMRRLEWPTLFCNDLEIAADGTIADYKIRQADGKQQVAQKLAELGFATYAVGDSYNDLGMILHADRSSFFRPPPALIKRYPQVPVCHTYAELLDDILVEARAAGNRPVGGYPSVS